ncbi:MAG TPA: hypothetical protein VKP03_02200 [Patescibacteria group bacterium]|nr:hypothetical protein [Patescibacteria group bacterium]
MAELAELQKGTKVWVVSVLQKGEIYPRKVYEIISEAGEKRVLLSKFPHERSYSPNELIANEIQATNIAIEAVESQISELKKKANSFRKRILKSLDEKLQKVEERKCYPPKMGQKTEERLQAVS